MYLDHFIRLIENPGSYSFFIQLAVLGHWDCFQISVIVMSAPMNIDAQIPFQIKKKNLTAIGNLKK